MNPQELAARRVRALEEFCADPSSVHVYIRQEFVDDHALGAIVSFGGIDVALPWCGWEILAALKYAGTCPVARGDARSEVEVMLTDSDLGKFTDPAPWLAD